MSTTSKFAGRILGEYQELGHGHADGPSLRDSVQQRGESHEADLVRYLRSGSVLAATTSRVRDVLSPGNELIGSLNLLTDGEWFWYTDLAHYVERYHVSLDARFIEHVRGRGWAPPLLSEADLIQLADVLCPEDEPSPLRTIGPAQSRDEQ